MFHKGPQRSPSVGVFWCFGISVDVNCDDDGHQLPVKGQRGENEYSGGKQMTLFVTPKNHLTLKIDHCHMESFRDTLFNLYCLLCVYLYKWP